MKRKIINFGCIIIAMLGIFIGCDNNTVAAKEEGEKLSYEKCYYSYSFGNDLSIGILTDNENNKEYIIVASSHGVDITERK